MERIRQISDPMREESGKKLILITLLMTVLVFITVLVSNGYNKLRLLELNISEVPATVVDRANELEMRTHLFEEDVLSRSKLGVKIYDDSTELSETGKLEEVCNMVSAIGVSLTDENGTVLNTAGVTSSVIFEEQISTCELSVPYFRVTTITDDDGTEVKQGHAFVMLPMNDGTNRRMVFDFSCKPLLDVYDSLHNWSDVLLRMMSGLDGYAFVQDNEEVPVTYSLDDLPAQEQEQLSNKAKQILDSRFLFQFGDDCFFKPVIFRHSPAIAVMQAVPEMHIRFLLLLPLSDLLLTGIYCALMITIFILFSLCLYFIYVLISISQKRSEKQRELFRRNPDRATRSGRLLILTAIAVFSVLLLMLESQATIASIATTDQVALQNNLNWHERYRKNITSSYEDSYLARTKALTEYLNKHKEYQTHESLKKLCDTINADYLVLFDQSGHETVASNTFTGFSIGDVDSSLKDDFKAVQLGYPYVVVGPDEDPYSGKQQIGVAVLLTKENGQADGFLLAAYDANNMNNELENASLENAVNDYAMAEGYKAAVINNKEGIFLAHTDRNKINQEADIAPETYKDDYAGFARYDEKDVYVSSVLDGERSVLVMVPDNQEDKMDLFTLVMIFILLMIIDLLYCPRACRLCMMARNEAMARLTDDDTVYIERTNPLLVFADGYAFFFTTMALATYLASLDMQWPAFTFVFSGLWSRGVHLFSLWAAVFFIAVIFAIAVVIRMILKRTARRTDLRTRTILKLVDSFVEYAVGIVLIIGVLYMFGVNTTALLASAGIVSIAVGMGSKDMVSDCLAGLFLTFENSIHIGDTVSVGSWKGVVTDMGIRTTEITDENKSVKILNNSRINDVVNMSRQKTANELELKIKRTVDMTKTEKILLRAIKETSEQMPELYGTLRLEGIHNITKKGCTAKLSYTCAEVMRDSVTDKIQTLVTQQVTEAMEAAAEKE